MILKKIEEYVYIIHFEKNISFSNNDHGYTARIQKHKFYHNSDKFFLDAFDFSLCYKFLELHETAKLFVNKFNEKVYSEKDLLLISDAKLFFRN